jgi:hypothetical protein
MSGIGSIFSGFGSLFGGSSAASGYREEAKFYGEAAQYQKLSGQLQDVAARRNAYQIIGKTQADVAGSGLKMAGSAVDVLRSNAQQASLTRSIGDINNNIQVQSYLAQQQGAEAEATASESSGLFGGLGQILGGGLALFGI